MRRLPDRPRDSPRGRVAPAYRSGSRRLQRGPAPAAGDRGDVRHYRPEAAHRYQLLLPRHPLHPPHAAEPAGPLPLPVGASLQRTEAVAGAFSAVLRQQPEIEATFAITGLNLLTGTNSSYAATIFIILKPWGQRAGAAHGSLALAARINKLA